MANPDWIATHPPAGSPDRIEVAKYDGETATKCWRERDEFAARIDIERAGDT